MQLFNVLKIFIVCLCFVAARKKIIHPLIVNGTDASHGQFPYQVYLCMKTPAFPILTSILGPISGTLYCSGHCGGILISEQWVLTAAHCMPNTLIRALLGTNKRLCWGWGCDGKLRDIPLNNRIRHPKYSDGHSGYDIGLLKLRQPVTFTKHIQPAKLPMNNSEVAAGEALTTSGWGLTKHKGTVASYLQYTTGKSISHEECSETFAGLSQDIICFKSDNGTGVCPGDSGGPLIVNKTGEVIGITSFMYDNEKGCEGGYPFAYTKVSDYIDWIHQHTGIGSKD